MTISGTTCVYALVGDPISHVRTPEVFNAHFADQNIDAVVVPVHVGPKDLSTVTAGLRSWHNLAGIGVTIPHKEHMTELVDQLTDQAARCGATNVVRRLPDGHLIGTQLDGVGFGDSLIDAGCDPAGRTALLVGAGGTAKAIAYDLAARGLHRLRVLNRTQERGAAIAHGVASAFSGTEASVSTTLPPDTDIVINATSLGMHAGDPMPVDPSLLTAGMTVADVVMNPPVTPLLAAAQQRQCTIHPGHLMHEAQIHATVQFLGLKSQVTP